MTITLRATKGSELTWDELDANFTDLETKGQWSTDVPPASAHTANDEFATSTLATKWTGVQMGDSPHVWDIDTTAKSKLWSKLPSSSTKYHSIVQAVPSGDFAAYTKTTEFHGTGFPAFGMILADGASAGAGNQKTYGLLPGYGVLSRRLTNYTTDVDYTNQAITSEAFRTFWMRLRRVGTEYYFALGNFDCDIWEVELNWNPTFTPTHIGVFHTNNGGNRSEVVFDYFRVLASGAAAPIPGNYIRRAP